MNRLTAMERIKIEPSKVVKQQPKGNKKQIWSRVERTGKEKKRSCIFTSNITNARSSKDADELTGRAPIVADGNDIGQSTMVLIHHFAEDVDKTVRGTAAGEDDHLPRRSGGHISQRGRLLCYWELKLPSSGGCI